jgi:hypothetical protein
VGKASLLGSFCRLFIKCETFLIELDGCSFPIAVLSLAATYRMPLFPLFKRFDAKTLNRYPELPWIPFSAIRALRLMRKEWIVREIGAGMSTIWGIVPRFVELGGMSVAG